MTNIAGTLVHPRDMAARSVSDVSSTNTTADSK
jgi:hypothetical protein